MHTTEAKNTQLLKEILQEIVERGLAQLPVSISKSSQLHNFKRWLRQDGRSMRTCLICEWTVYAGSRLAVSHIGKFIGRRAWLLASRCSLDSGDR